ncbi:Multi antimicrobial extrusion protein [Corchorus capsularis]|uniref:Multi antimicrobial extrusion protein n=1 Tax=Corchorus capsularis TaxID=210143 RepID=A0A1R3ICH7_COCAP|nr:Multi antimicrobial extrusion protein [Corchorus capsularis]
MCYNKKITCLALATIKVPFKEKKTEAASMAEMVEKKWAVSWGGYMQELKKGSRIAVPMVAVALLQYLLQVVSVIMVGHLGQLSLSSVAIATSLTNVTGFSLLAFYQTQSLKHHTRVSNELGAGNPEIARRAVKVGMSMATIEAIIVSVALFFSRHIVGYAYSNEKPVVKYVAAMAPLLCISLVTDSIQAVLSGVAKGCGWQSLGAYANLGAFYLIGLPIGIVLGFVAHLKGRGLWIGIVAGSIVQTILLSLFAIFTNWEKQVAKAKERVSTRNSSSQN